MLRRVYLHGSLRQFGTHYDFDVDTAHEAARALACLVPGMERALAAGTFKVVAGSLQKGKALGEDRVGMYLGKADRLHIVPVAAGSKGRGLKIVTGLALMAVGIYGGWWALPQGMSGFGVGVASSGPLSFVTFGDLVLAGGLIALSGAAQLLAPQVKSNQDDSRDDRTSFVYNGPTNRAGQGFPLPVPYGLVLTTGPTINAGLTTEDYDGTP